LAKLLRIADSWVKELWIVACWRLACPEFYFDISSVPKYIVFIRITAIFSRDRAFTLKTSRIIENGLYTYIRTMLEESSRRDKTNNKSTIWVMGTFNKGARFPGLIMNRPGGDFFSFFRRRIIARFPSFCQCLSPSVRRLHGTRHLYIRGLTIK